jgi:hypothetical protein
MCMKKGIWLQSSIGHALPAGYRPELGGTDEPQCQRLQVTLQSQAEVRRLSGVGTKPLQGGWTCTLYRIEFVGGQGGWLVLLCTCV